MNTTTRLLTIAAALAIAACNQEQATEQNAPGDPGGKGAALDAILVAESPANPISVLEARKLATPGTEVTVAGKIMGRMEPFVDGRALVVLGDPSAIVSCDLRPGDTCETPWDNCCDDPGVIKQSIVTVQVVDAKGAPLKEGLKGLGGMKELSSLVVTGKVAEGSNPDNLIINATGIHVAMAEPTRDNPAQP